MRFLCMVTMIQAGLLKFYLSVVQDDISSSMAVYRMMNTFNGTDDDHDMYVDDLYAFTMRDALHLTSNQLVAYSDYYYDDSDSSRCLLHIYDYNNLESKVHIPNVSQTLFLDGRKIAESPCSWYSTKCYREKILQAWHVALKQTNSKYFFYMESDNDLCISLDKIRELAVKENRFFISVGVGASGWIMRRDFVEGFLQLYAQPKNDEGPDIVAGKWLKESGKWSVAREYLVSHTLLPAVGSQSLTVKRVSRLHKHLPRCREPHRSVWSDNESNPHEDMYGWDYFDYDWCPNAYVFPCSENQVEPKGKPKAQTLTTNNHERQPPERHTLESRRHASPGQSQRQSRAIPGRHQPRAKR